MELEATSPLPTGEQFEISRGSLRAIVTEVGATLRVFESGGEEVISGFAEQEMSSASRGQVLLPWPNRIAGGHYEFMGEKYQLPVNEVERDTALHGLVRWSSWRLLSRSPSAVTLGLRLYPQQGYPFVVDLEVGYELTQTGLTVRITATNSGESPLPYGAGNHPYLTAGTPKVDPATLQLPADAYYETDDRLLPQRRASVEGTEYDFREARPIGETRLDTCFTGLAHDPDGRARAYLRDPATGRGVEVWMDESYRYLQVFTGDTLPGEKYRSAVAIEPMTCAPDAFNSGDGLVVLEPGESFTSAWGMDVLT